MPIIVKTGYQYGLICSPFVSTFPYAFKNALPVQGKKGKKESIFHKPNLIYI